MTGHPCPAGCGRCCNPVTLPFSIDDVRLARSDELDEADRRWITEDLTPIRRRDGLAAADYLTAGGKTVYLIDGKPVILWTYFYTCRWFDEDSLLCTNYQNRPPMCAGYPWYGDPPDRQKVLPPECVYQEDIGRTPVSLRPKPERTP